MPRTFIENVVVAYLDNEVSEKSAPSRLAFFRSAWKSWALVWSPRHCLSGNSLKGSLSEGSAVRKAVHPKKAGTLGRRNCMLGVGENQLQVVPLAAHP